jgi:adenylate kinase family enzyme
MEDVTKPRLRPQPNKIERTLILINGNSFDGKSYLSSQLINSNVDFISMDTLVVLNTEIVSIENFKKTIKNPIGSVNVINKHINNTSSKEFISFLFNEYIDKYQKNTILLEGHIFTFDNIIKEIKKNCKNSSTRLWIVKKEKF